MCVFSFFVHFFLVLSHCKLQSAIKFSPSLCLAIFPPAREIKLYFGWNFACALQLQIMSLCTSPIVVMVIRKYSVGHPDNAQQKVQFVKLLGSANTHKHTHTHTHTQRNIIFWRGRSNFINNVYSYPQEALLARDYLHYEERLMQFAFFTHLFLHPLCWDWQHTFIWRPTTREAPTQIQHFAVAFIITYLKGDFALQPY